MEVSASRSRNRRAWERFVSGDESALAGVRPLVRDSWVRSRNAGIDPGRRGAPIVLTAAEAAALTEESEDLRQAAAPALRLLSRALEGDSFLLMLGDPLCRPLEVVGDAKSVSAAETINVVVGSQWTEAETGTDALAVSTLLGLPVQIQWFEHYLEIGHRWAGNTAPIFRPLARDLVGSLSLYGYEVTAHPRALDLVMDAVRLIEQQLYRVELGERVLLYEACDRILHKHPGEASFALDAKGRIAIRASEAANFVTAPAEGLRSRPFFQLPGIHVAEEALTLRRGETSRIRIHVDGRGTFPVSVSPVQSGKNLAGFVVSVSQSITPRKATVAHRVWPAPYTFASIAGASPEIRSAIADATRTAEHDLPVLITGESGTGKELFAQAIHNASRRGAGPFVPLNCGALNEELLGAELFGYSDGAFTGALRNGKAGKFELANQGTLFLDEVEEMSPRMQSHLLRVLEDGRVTRIGGERPLPVDVRIVAATNSDLGVRMTEGTFRRDLFYRLAVTVLSIPPLRMRKGDVGLLATHLLQGSHPRKRLADDLPARLDHYCWPGNVRELRNVILHAGARAHDVVTADDLPETLCPLSCAATHCPYRAAPPTIRSDRPSEPKLKPMDLADRDAILGALRACDGNVSSAAARLGLHRVTFHRKMRKLGIHAGRVFD